MRPNISFIIPMYNVEKYIEKAIMSVVDNDWGHVRFEIIVVDDESPDNSLIIAKNIAENRSNIKVITQKNKGLGGARNTGITAASGEYLFFLDSDDYLIKNQIQEVLHVALDNNLDVLEFAAQSVNENYENLGSIFHIHVDKIIKGTEYMLAHKSANSACNKLYNRCFLVENHIEFMEKVYVEDAPFNIEVYVKARKVMAIDKVVVAFLQNSKSITRTRRSGAVMKKFIDDSLIIIKYINSFSTSYDKAVKRNPIMMKVASFTCGTILMILKSNESTSVKKGYISHLKKSGLYPIRSFTGELYRDIFMIVINRSLFLNFLISFSKTRDDDSTSSR